MEESKFFKYLWRFNALVISLAGIGAVILVSTIAYELLSNRNSDPQAIQAPTTDKTQNLAPIKVDYSLSGFSKVDDLPILVAELNRNHHNKARFSKSYDTTIHNLFYYNIDENSYSWLFDHNGFIINYQSGLYRKIGTKKEISRVVTILSITKQDTNNDGLLTAKDNRIFAVVKPNGSDYTELVNDIDTIHDSYLIDKERLYVVLIKDKKHTAYIINLNNFEIVDEQIIPLIPQAK